MTALLLANTAFIVLLGLDAVETFFASISTNVLLHKFFSDYSPFKMAMSKERWITENEENISITSGLRKKKLLHSVD